MNYNYSLVADASTSERAIFYKKTYLHVSIAILAFIAVETILQKIIPQEIIFKMISSRFIWLFILGAFWLGSMLSNKLAFAQSRNTQYFGLLLYVLIEAIIFLPMIAMATLFAGESILIQAAAITLFMFGGLTAISFFSKTDFSFLKSALIIGGFISLGIIVVGAMFGFNLGLWFSAGMILLASGSILYQTSQIKHHYHTEQYVGAALQLFAAIMLLFWYVLRILLRLAKRD
jgi:FtsH-binding integral membrane protein